MKIKFRDFTKWLLTLTVLTTLVSCLAIGAGAENDESGQTVGSDEPTVVYDDNNEVELASEKITVNISMYSDFPSDEYEAEDGANALEFLSSSFPAAAAYDKIGWELVRDGRRSYVTEDTVLCDGDTYYMIWWLANGGDLGIFGICTADMFEDIEYNSYVISDNGGVFDIYHTIDGVEYRFAVDPVNFTIGSIFSLMDIDTSKTYTVNGVEVSYTDQLPLKSTAFETLASTGSITVELYVESDRAEDMARDFKFTVELINYVLNGKYGDMTFTNGVAEIVLKDGEYITAEGLPAEIGYTVKGETVDGFEIKSHGATGDSTAQGVVASFVYTYKPYAIYTLAGSFTGWDPKDTSYDFTRNEDGKYVFETELDSGIHEFKVAKDHDWAGSLGANVDDSNIITNGIAATVYESGYNLTFTLNAKTVVTFTLDPEANTITVSWEESDPVVTDISFNTDSEAYDAETNTFSVSDDSPFILMISGSNLTKYSERGGLEALFQRDVSNAGWKITSVQIMSDTAAYLTVDTSVMTWILADGFGAKKATAVMVRNGETQLGETIYVVLQHAPTYRINIIGGEGGTVSHDKFSDFVPANETVTLAIDAENGYVLDKLIVDGTDVTEEVSDNAYQFIMPEKAIDISCSFKADPSIKYEVTGTVRLERKAEYGYARNDKLGFSNAGKIVITKDGNSVYEATEEALEITSDENGKAVISFFARLSAGTYELTFTKNGYTQETVVFDVTDKAVALNAIVPVCGDIRGEFDAECGDGTVDLSDFIRVLRGFNSDASEYVSFSVDLNEDGVVNVNDLAIVKYAISLVN